MLSPETLSVFFLASVVLALAPGPDNIFVLAQSAMFGRTAGLLVTLGLCSGLLVHTTLVSVGVAAIFQTSVYAFNGLKIIGGVYLLYLAWQSFRAGGSGLEQQTAPVMTPRQLYARGVIMNVTNPKVAIFFLAFLPQFAEPALGSVTLQIFLLGSLFMVATLIIFGAVAWFSGYLGDWMRDSDRAQKMINRVAGTVFVGLALRLLTSSHSTLAPQ